MYNMGQPGPTMLYHLVQIGRGHAIRTRWDSMRLTDDTGKPAGGGAGLSRCEGGGEEVLLRVRPDLGHSC